MKLWVIVSTPLGLWLGSLGAKSIQFSPRYGSKPPLGLGFGSLGHLWTGEVGYSLDWTLAPLVLLAIEVFEVLGNVSTPLGLGLGSLGAQHVQFSPGYGSKPPLGLGLGSWGHLWTGEVGDYLDWTSAPLVLLAFEVFEVPRTVSTPLGLGLGSLVAQSIQFSPRYGSNPHLGLGLGSLGHLWTGKVGDSSTGHWPLAIDVFEVLGIVSTSLGLGLGSLGVQPIQSSPGYGSQPPLGLGLGFMGHLWTGERGDSLDWSLFPLGLLDIEVFEVLGIVFTPLGLGLSSLGAQHIQSSPGYGSKPSQGLGLGSLGHLWTGEVRDSLDWTLAPLVLLAIEVFEVPGIFSTPLGLGLGSLGAQPIKSSPRYDSKPTLGLGLGSLCHLWTGEVGDSLYWTLAPQQGS